MSIHRVTVLGAGTMGHGIAHVCAQADCTVKLFDIKEDLIERGLNKIKSNLDKGVAKEKISPLQRTTTLNNLSGSRICFRGF